MHYLKNCFSEKAFNINRVQYGKIGAGLWHCFGLPEGLEFKTPAKYGPRDCNKIIASKHNIEFKGVFEKLYF